MNGSRLGRGRAGRLGLLLAGFIVFCSGGYFFRKMSAEKAKLHDLNFKCLQEHKALSAQLEVIYDYKIQLEKTLSNEKSSNAAAKEELQKKASLERTMRDKDSMEALQRYNSLQQQYKLLQTEHQDFKDDCKKKEEVAYDNANKYESKLVELRKALKQAADSKDILLNEKSILEGEKKSLEMEKEDLRKSLDSLKSRYMENEHEKEQLEEAHADLQKATGNNNSELERLQKQVIELTDELMKGKPPSSNGVVGPSLNSDNHNIDNNYFGNQEPPPSIDKSQPQLLRSSFQQQVSSPSEAIQVGQNPPPLQAPQSNRHLVDLAENNDEIADNADERNNAIDDSLPSELKSDVRFESRDGNIVPVGPNEHDQQQQQQQQAFLSAPSNQEVQSLQRQQTQKRIVAQKAAVAELPKQALSPPLESMRYLGDSKRDLTSSSPSEAVVAEPLSIPIN